MLTADMLRNTCGESILNTEIIKECRMIDGTLTESDKEKLKEFIADFYSSHEGSQALANANNHW